MNRPKTIVLHYVTHNMQGPKLIKNETVIIFVIFNTSEKKKTKKASASNKEYY